MPKRLDLTGQRFGFLVVQSFAFYSKQKRHCYWNCLCDCGNKSIVSAQCLRRGYTKSCGCYNSKLKKQFGGHHITHGYSSHPICNTYWSMKARCYNKNHDAYKRYGGRGITVCEEWLHSSDAFVKWALENGWKEGLTLDRIDVNGNYEPKNCRWITRSEQALNKRNTIFITYKNQKLTISQWSVKTGLSYTVINTRRHKGWSPEKILNTPINPKFSNKKTKGGSK